MRIREFGELDIGYIFYSGFYKYMKIETVVDYDNAGQKYNSVIIDATSNDAYPERKGFLYFFGDREEVEN